MNKVIDNKNFSFAQSFVKGEISLGFWAFAKKGVGMINSFFILSSLVVYQYGVYQLLLSAYAFASDFFHSLFSTVVVNDLVRMIGEGKEDKAKKLFWEYSFFRLITGIIPAALIFFLAPLFSFRYGPEAIIWIRLLAPLFLIDAILPLGILLLKLRLRFNIFSMQPIIQKIIHMFILGYFFFFSHLAIREILIAQILAPTIAILVFVVPIIKTYRIWHNVKAYSGGLLFSIIRSYGKWEIPQFFTSDVSGQIRPWLIKLFLSTEAVGIFSVANIFVGAIRDLLPTRTLSLLVPRKVHDKEYFSRLFLYGTKYYVLLSLIFMGASAIGVPLAIHLFFAKYTGSIPLFWLLLPSVLIFAFVKLTNILLVAERRQKFIFYQLILLNMLNLFFLVLLMPVIGIWGVALAELLAALISAAIKYRYLVWTKFIARIPLRKIFSFESQDHLIFSVLWRNLFSFLLKR